MTLFARINLGTTMVVAIVASAAVVLMLLGATPSQIGPIGVTAWFLAFCLALATILALSLQLAKRLISKKSSQANLKASVRQGSLIAFWVTVNLALSSLRQLSLRDCLLSAILVVLIEFYLRLK